MLPCSHKCWVDAPTQLLRKVPAVTEVSLLPIWFTPWEINKQLRSLHTAKSLGSDNIQSALLFHHIVNYWSLPRNKMLYDSSQRRMVKILSGLKIVEEKVQERYLILKRMNRLVNMRCILDCWQIEERNHGGIQHNLSRRWWCLRTWQL